MDNQIYFLESSRLGLREVRLEDANGPYYTWMNDPEITQFTESRFFPYSKKQLEQYIQSMDGSRSSAFFAIIEKDSGCHIGNIKLGGINWTHRYADLGIIIGEKRCWGKGYATEAIRLICRYGFEQLNLARIWAGFYSNNPASICAFSKVGFQQEGVLRQQYQFKGERIDGIVMGLLREEWKALGN